MWSLIDTSDVTGDFLHDIISERMTGKEKHPSINNNDLLPPYDEAVADPGKLVFGLDYDTLHLRFPRSDPREQEPDEEIWFECSGKIMVDGQIVPCPFNFKSIRALSLTKFNVHVKEETGHVFSDGLTLRLHNKYTRMIETPEVTLQKKKVRDGKFVFLVFPPPSVTSR